GAVPCTESRAVKLNGHCYFATTGRSSWDDSKAACAAASAHLVTITSTEEQNVVSGLASNQDRWIGLSRPVGSPMMPTSYVWITGEPVSFTSWDTTLGEPNYTGECVRVRSPASWADYACLNLFMAVCERE